LRSSNGCYLGDFEHRLTERRPAILTHDVRAASGDGRSTSSADIEPWTTMDVKQGAQACEAQGFSARVRSLIDLGPSQSTVDECAQLFAHRNRARRQQLRVEDDHYVVDRANPEEGACRPAPAIVADLR
jgi:hypothetical protein